jgi:hypothetical protein
MNNIPYKEALELKELGFDEKTDVWRQHGEGISGDVEGKKDYWNRKGVVYTALPTYSQAFRWFRDKYGLAAVLDYFNDCKWTYKIFEFTNTNMTPDIHQGDYSKERTYEEAEHDCLVGLIRFANRFAKKEQNEQRRSEWGLSMADAITVDDAKSLQEYAESLGKAAMGVLYGVRLDGIPRETLGKQICDLHDRLGFFTAVLDRIDENRQ